MNVIIGNVDQTYVGNKNLMELREKLDEVQSCMTEYLNTRDEDALREFYSRTAEYKELMGVLNRQILDSDNLIMEKNIYVGGQKNLENWIVKIIVSCRIWQST